VSKLVEATVLRPATEAVTAVFAGAATPKRSLSVALTLTRPFAVLVIVVTFGVMVLVPVVKRTADVNVAVLPVETPISEAVADGAAMVNVSPEAIAACVTEHVTDVAAAAKEQTCAHVNGANVLLPRMSYDESVTWTYILPAAAAAAGKVNFKPVEVLVVETVKPKFAVCETVPS